MYVLILPEGYCEMILRHEGADDTICLIEFRLVGASEAPTSQLGIGTGIGTARPETSGLDLLAGEGHAP